MLNPHLCHYLPPFLIVILSTLAVGCAKLSPLNLLNMALSDQHYEVTADLAYGRLPRQKMDIYTPRQEIARAQATPLIVFVHGGAWRNGDKQDYRFVAQALTQAGYTVMIPNYRLHPEVTFPSFVDDIAQAIAVLEQNASELLSKPMPDFVLMGHSAGAHTAAVLTTDQRYFQRVQLQSHQRGLIALAGPYDLNLNDPEVAPVFAGASRADAVPVVQIHADMPDVLLLHGKGDKRVGAHHTDRFIAALSRAKIKASAKQYTRVNHVNVLAGIAAPLRFLSPSYQDILDFLQRLGRMGDIEGASTQ